MKPYGQGLESEMKGYSGLRSSKDSTHRRRCLRVDKKRARKRARDECLGRGRPHGCGPL